MNAINWYTKSEIDFQQKIPKGQETNVQKITALTHKIWNIFKNDGKKLNKNIHKIKKHLSLYMTINILSINVYQNLNFSGQNNKIKVEDDGTQ